MIEWFRGGDPGYHVLTHCMRGDTPWAYAFAALSTSLLLAYMGIAWVWLRAALSSPDNTRKRLLLALFTIFLLCGAVHSSRAISLWWPGYRLFVMLLVALNLASWGFLVVSAPRAREVFSPEGDALFESVWASGGVGIALVGLDWRFLRANGGVCDLLGYDEKTLALLTFADITHPEDLDEDLALLREVEAGAREHYTLRKRYAHAAGGWVWAQLTVSAARDPRGRPTYWIAQIVSVQDDVESVQAARREVACLRAELSSTRDLVVKVQGLLKESADG